MFQEQAWQEQFEIVKSLMACINQDVTHVCTNIQKMKSYMDRLENLGIGVKKELIIDMVFNSLFG